MLRPFVAPEAQRDLLGILELSEERFGVAARRRYERLIERTIVDLAAAPERLGSRARPDLGPGLRTYHLAFSRRRGWGGGDSVRSPRHLLVYRVAGETHLEIVRVLHDRMDLGQHVPDAPADGDAE